METRKSADSGNCCVFCKVPDGTKVVSNATLRGVECQHSSGAKHRGGLGNDLGAGSCLRSRHYCSGLRCLWSRDRWLLWLAFCCLCGGRSADAKGSCNLPGFWSLEEVLEVAVFAEDVGERLFDDIVGASAYEVSVLIDLSCGCVGQPNRRADLTGLNDFE
jgi:hypothetical protein